MPAELSEQEQKHYALVQKRPEAVAYAKEHGDSAAAANFGYDPDSVKSWRTKEAAYKEQQYVRNFTAFLNHFLSAALRKKAQKMKKAPDVPEKLTHQEREKANRVITCLSASRM